MTKLPAYNYRRVVKKLKKLGFNYERQAKGSHELWYNPKTGQRTMIPHHAGKTIKKKTLRSIIKQTGASVKKFIKL